MADGPTTATAHHTAHLIIYATGGAAQPRRDSPTVGYRDHISEYTVSQSATDIIRRDQTKEQDIRYHTLLILAILEWEQQ